MLGMLGMLGKLIVCARFPLPMTDNRAHTHAERGGREKVERREKRKGRRKWDCAVSAKNSVVPGMGWPMESIPILAFSALGFSAHLLAYYSNYLGLRHNMLMAIIFERNNRLDLLRRVLP